MIESGRAPALFHESFADALQEIVSAAGGFKKVAAPLKPERTAEAAGRWLHDCFNESRPDHLTPDQVLYLLKLGRAIGCDGGMNYLLREAGYADAKPVEPRDAVQELMSQFNASVAAQKTLLARFEQVAALLPAAAVRLEK